MLNRSHTTNSHDAHIVLDTLEVTCRPKGLNDETNNTDAVAPYVDLPHVCLTCDHGYSNLQHSQYEQSDAMGNRIGEHSEPNKQHL